MMVFKMKVKTKSIVLDHVLDYILVQIFIIAPTHRIVSVVSVLMVPVNVSSSHNHKEIFSCLFFSAATCYDGVQNEGENQIDCLGPCAGLYTCQNHYNCTNSSDCISRLCGNGTCQRKFITQS